MFTHVRGDQGNSSAPAFDRLKRSLKVAKVTKVAKVVGTATNLTP